MDIRGIPNEKVNGGDAFEQQRQVTRTDSNEASSRNKHLDRTSDVGRLPSSDLVRFAAKLKRAPEIRNDVVSVVKDRVKSGYYLTRDAAERTARALTKE